MPSGPQKQNNQEKKKHPCPLMVHIL